MSHTVTNNRSDPTPFPSGVWGTIVYSSTRELGCLLADLLSLRLVGVIGARNYVWSSFSQWTLSITYSSH